MAVTIAADERRELEDQGADDAIAEIDRRERARLLDEYPKPDAAAVLDWKQYLDEQFRPFWFGNTRTSATTTSNEIDGGDSLASIRDMRYGRDTTPEKLRKNMEHTYRVRSMFSHNEIDRVVALLGRNPLKVRVPQAGTRADDAKRAEKQSEFCNALPVILDQQAPFPLIQRTDDALTEAGLVAAEFYLTGTYDDLDWEYQEFEESGEDGAVSKRRETDAERADRLRSERRQRTLPFGVRYVDPSSVRFEMDEGKVCVALICEKKRWRNVRSRVMKARQVAGVDNPDTIPKPGDLGSHGDSASSLSGISDAAEVDTIRYYDEYWYAYVVAGQLVECEPHGLPGVPVIIGTGRVTSSSSFNEMFQGVTWGRTAIEQLFNDLMSVTGDAKATYNRPKPIAMSDSPAATGFNQSSAVTIDLQGDDLVLLPPGYQLDDAFKHWRSNENDGFLQLLMSLYQMGGMSPISQGESPGSDVSGYLVNTLQGAANAKYEGLLDNKCRFWRSIIDFARATIRDVIGEEVEIQDLTGGDDGDSASWLTLGPEDIDKTPCVVAIDPLSEQDKMALAQFYMMGLQAGLVPPDEVMRRVYGATNIEQWTADIARGSARQKLAERAIQDAMERVEEEAADRAARNAPAPTVYGPDGRPLPPSPRGPADVPPPSALPGGQPPTGPTVGAQAMDAMRSVNPQTAGFSAGQRPISNGMTAGEAAGA